MSSRGLGYFLVSLPYTYSHMQPQQTIHQDSFHSHYAVVLKRSWRVWKSMVLSYRSQSQPNGLIPWLWLKNHTQLRVCLDLRDLNKAIKRSHYPLPTLEDITSRLGGAQYFSVLDARSGYWAIKLADESSRLTTFNTVTVTDMESPKDKGQLETVLGMINYLKSLVCRLMSQSMGLELRSNRKRAFCDTVWLQALPPVYLLPTSHC